MTEVYEKAVEKTFVKSLRSVFLVDDAFPSFSDMFKSPKAQKRFKERDRADRLYRAFRNRQLPCDIENTFKINDMKMVERLRKCDLIVLDFHLDSDEGDNSKSLQILRRLADSAHFNTIVVYTKKPELNEVWLDVASNLRPDLRFSASMLSGPQAEWWSAVDTSALVVPSEAAISKFLTAGVAAVDKAERTEIINSIRNAGGQGELKTLLEAWLRHHVDKRRPASFKKLDDRNGAAQRSLQGRFDAAKPYWLQCSGCFIAIVKKVDDEETEAAVLMDRLNAALLDWKPNFLQILVSEIQNNLELESLAADPKLFSDVERQVGLSHYLLEQIKEEDDESAVEALVDRVVETVRHRISGDAGLRAFAAKVLSDVKADLGGGIETADAIANARALAHVESAPDAKDVIFLLNSFLSTEAFSRSRVTTGTVFRKDDHYWMVTTPACDLTSRPPGAAQAWLKDMHPVRAMLAVSLEKVTAQAALEFANRGQHAFLQDGPDVLPLKILDKQTSAPAPEMFFALDAGKVTAAPGKPGRFRAARVIRSARARPTLVPPASFFVIGQLRPNYASRILQLAGAHLARIGIDFFNG